MDNYGRQLADFVLDYYAKHKLFTLLMMIPAGIVYFLPGIIAITRERKNSTAIFLLNLFLGWSLLGWVIALVWSVKEVPPFTPPNNQLEYTVYKPKLKYALWEAWDGIKVGLWMLVFSIGFYAMGIYEVWKWGGLWTILGFLLLIGAVGNIIFRPFSVLFQEFFMNYQLHKCDVCTKTSKIYPRAPVSKCTGCGAVYQVTWKEE